MSSRPPVPPKPIRFNDPSIDFGGSAAAAYENPTNQVLYPSLSTPSRSRPDYGGPSRPVPPPLPLSLMPGNARDDEAFSPQDSTLFFENRTPPTRSAPASTLNGYGRGNARAGSRPRTAVPPPSLPPKEPLLPRGLSFESIVSYPRLPPKVPIIPPKLAMPEPDLSGSAKTGEVVSKGKGKGPASPPSYLDLAEERPPEKSPAASKSEEDLARALEISLKEDVPGEQREEEDEEFKRALEASMEAYDSFGSEWETPAFETLGARAIPLPTTPRVPPASPPAMRSSASVMSASSRRTSSTNEAVEDVGSGSDITDGTSGHDGAHSTVDELAGMVAFDDDLRRQQLEMDERMARELALEEEADVTTPSRSSTPASGTADTHMPLPTPPVPLSTRPLPSAAQLPRYDEAMRNNGRSSSFSAVSPTPPAPPLPRSSVSCTAAPAGTSPSPRVSPTPPVTEERPPPPVVPVFMLGRSATTQPISTIAEEAPEAPEPPAIVLESRPSTVIPVSRTSSFDPTSRQMADSKIVLSPPEPQAGSPSGEEGEDDPTSPARPVSVSSMSGIDDALLMGVSIGFNRPAMSVQLLPMQGPIPNIISLPYGKCPPLHMHAPSWKQLLKLMARLSDSRIEPTVEALAANKTELKLRTVVQFIRLHPSSKQWRTIVYLTIDVPVPAATPNAFKYSNGDVSTLPYSYTLSSIPPQLLHGSDSPLAKAYTIPITSRTPFPTLPITLPNLAMYLNSALEDSRRAVNDTSGGLRKLAKMVEEFYPADTSEDSYLGPDAAVPDRLSVGGLWKRAFRRGERSSSSNSRGGNADTYDLITPFRLDEYA